ncbi:MAG: DNRLRE domain-containing protein [Luteolibacter sp.]
MNSFPFSGTNLRFDPQNIKALACSSLLLAGMFAPSAHALTGTIYGVSSDGQANSDGTISSTTSLYGRLGADAGIRHSVIHVFEIPSTVLADPTQRFSAASYSTKIGLGSSNTLNVDLYGVGFGTSPAIAAADFYEGASDGANVLLKDNFIIPTTPAYSTITESGSALVTYLNECLDAARLSSAPTAYIFIRNSLDAYIWSSYYPVGMNEAGGSYLPTIAYTTVTVPVWSSVPLGGGGFVTGLASTSDGSNIYCRTDVGGAFRWAPTGDAAGNGSWVSLSDTMIPFGTPNARAVMGVESIATDPSNTSRLYIGAGNGIYLSDNQGNSWTLISPVIAMSPNGGYRSCGERLAVDPNNPNIVWYGSINNGLQKGDKTSGTWVWSTISTASVPTGTANAGITFVACDQNSGSTIVYAGVVGNATTGGVYKSTDNGITWAKVGITAGQTLTNPRRAQITSNGTVYVTAGGDGVFKLPGGPSTVLTQLTSLPTTILYQSGPVQYQGVAVDPNDATGNTVYIAEGNWQYQYNNIWRSTNGGTTWSTQDTIFNGVKPNGSTISNARTEPDGTPCLTGYWFGNTSSLMINPANSAELWAADFFGVARTRDAQNLGNNTLPPSGPGGCQWSMLQKGQEETVVAVAKNAPSGARLLTGVGDVGGCRYTDISMRPSGAGGNRFSNPGGGNTTSLDFSESDPNLWVRAWVEQASQWKPGNGSLSKDGGASWMTFGQIDQAAIAAATPNTWIEWDVAPYLKQHAGGQVTLIVRGNTTGALLTFDSKEGTNAPQLVVNGSTPLAVTEDTYVQDGTSATVNNGTAISLLAKQDTVNNQRWTYLKFDLTGISSITTAKLRMFLQSSNSTVTALAAVHAGDVTSWTEGALTWNTRPLFKGISGIYASAAPPILVNGSNGGGGGRIAISATDTNNIVWMPINYSQATIPAYYSKDRGVTWAAGTGAFNSPIAGVYTNGNSLGMSGQCLAADRGNGKFYLAKFGGASHLIYSSTDGAAWAQVGSVSNGGTYNMRTPQIVAAPVSTTCPSGGDVWVCDDSDYLGTHAGGGLWRSTNSGANWSQISGIGRVTAVGFGKSVSGMGYAVYFFGYNGTTLGIYRSEDYGTSWIKLIDPTIEQINTLSGDRQNPGKVFIGTGGRGMFVGQ